MIDGTEVTLNGNKMVAPPLALGALKRLLPRIKVMKNTGGLPSEDDIDTIVTVVHAALVRNYPDLTVQAVEDGLDTGNMVSVMSAVMSNSGLVRGNAPAATALEEAPKTTGDASSGS